MKYDGSIDIATGLSAGSRTWVNKNVTWSDFLAKIMREHKTNETLKEFLKATKEEQTKIKDVGGYVGGYLRGGRRSKNSVVYRQMLTLDIDFANLFFWDDFTMFFDNAAVIHSTHKHSEEAPRYRLLLPVSREMTSEEYQAVGRKVAGDMGIELFDNTTFEPNRLMFWPSTPKDQDYYYQAQDGPWLDVDEVLSSYIDWKDSSLWPTAETKLEEVKALATKQADPETKKGVIGAFCRAYTIQEVIDTFLKEEYVATDNGRYTYLKGSTSAGLITYEDKFTYSHHGTDPTSGKLCNAFDLVRIHKFGHLGVKSARAMEDFAREDSQTKGIIAEDNINTARFDFAVEPEETQEVDLEWAKELEVDPRGIYKSTAPNINLVLANDPLLKGLFKRNVFENKPFLFGTVPWRKIKSPEPVRNVDYSGLRNYIESVYGIASSLKIEDSLALEFEKHSFHPVVDYLKSLAWDGTPRIEELLIDYFGAADNVYTREAIKKTLVGAVARVYRPGCKFDLVLTLVGQKEGTGKSTFFRKLGKEWFSDTFTTVHGKEAFEQVIGHWIIELAELAGTRKADIEPVKHFLTKQEDIFRPAFGRVSETHKRQGVFVATTNDDEFLRVGDNRRFMPIEVRHEEALKSSLSSDLDEEVDQIWAEAVRLYEKGEPLYLSDASDALADKERKRHVEVDEREGLIELFLDIKLPKNWASIGLEERRTFFEMGKEGTEQRQHVCVAEIWAECLNKERRDMTRYSTRDINSILRGLEGWEQSWSTKNFAFHGKQKYYTRIIKS